MYALVQEWANLAIPGHFPSEFSSNPNQTHLKQLIIVFKTARRLQAGEFYQGWVKSLQEMLEEPSLPITALVYVYCLRFCVNIFVKHYSVWLC